MLRRHILCEKQSKVRDAKTARSSSSALVAVMHACASDGQRGATCVQILEALDKIKAGERFDAVAAACSEDKARQGGDLGWKTRQDVVVRVQSILLTTPLARECALQRHGMI